jgi:alpha-methylacyl-CoA racemase
VYETADGRHMAVGALEHQFYAEFIRLLFAPEGAPGDLPAQHDRSRWPELRSRFSARFLERSQGEWSRTFHGTDACVAPVLSMTEAPSDAHLAARGTYVTSGGVVQPAPAPRFGSGAPGTPIGALPARPIAPVGANTRAVLSDFGFEDADELLASGAAWQA